MPNDETIAFQCFRLNVRRHQLRLENGGEVKLGGRPLELLEILIRHRDRLMTQQDLLTLLYRGENKSEGILGVQLSTLRTALRPHWDHDPIKTITGRGYQFIDDIQPLAPQPLPPPPLPPAAGPPAATPPFLHPAPARSRSRTGVAISVAACLVAIPAVWMWRSGSGSTPPLSLVVLPFRSLSEGEGRAYMAAAITADLNTNLQRLPGSSVTSPESAELLRDGKVPLDRIGRELHVRYVLSGDLRADDAGSHINARLIDAATGRQLWSRRFDVAPGGLAQTQSTIVNDIASALDVALPGIVVAHQRPDDPEAEDLFYRALSIMATQDSSQGYAEAARLLERSVALQPEFNDARAELGLALVLKFRSAEDPTQAADLAEARSNIDRALTSSRDATALAANARLLEAQDDFDGAVANAQEALVLEPNNVQALATLAKCATIAGRLDEASGFLQTLLRLNPDPGRIGPRLALLSQIALFQGRYQEAISYGRKSLAGEASPHQGADTMGRAEYSSLLIMSATALSGDIAGAHALHDVYRRIWPNRSAWRVGAYSPRGIVALPGFNNFLIGLTRAGMPMFATSGAPADGVTAASLSGDFATPPQTIDRIEVIDTQRLLSWANQPDVTILDFGHGAATLSRARLLGNQAAEAAAPKQWLATTPAANDPAAPIIVMSDGYQGLTSAKAARVLVGGGHTNVYWYQGGEEALAASGTKTAVDRR